MKSSALIGVPSLQTASALSLYVTVCTPPVVLVLGSSLSRFWSYLTVKSGWMMNVSGRIRPVMSCTVVTLPAEMYGNRFCGQSSAAPYVAEPPLPLSPDPLLSLLPPPHAVSAIAPAMPVAISAAWRLLNFTCDASLVPRCAGGTDSSDGAGLGQPD